MPFVEARGIRICYEMYGDASDPLHELSDRAPDLVA
jgi:hypothetical protein